MAECNTDLGTGVILNLGGGSCLRYPGSQEGIFQSAPFLTLPVTVPCDLLAHIFAHDPEPYGLVSREVQRPAAALLQEARADNLT